MMRGEITSIRIICKYGAYGDSRKFGMWIYGKRPGGRTVACKNKITEKGGMKIWSAGYETEFSAKEWQKIRQASRALQPAICNEILLKRKNRGTNAPDR